LHPSAIREACDLLYGLPMATGNWQVMVTTHSPCFVDFARAHTSVVRVERTANGQVSGTTIFRPSKANFDGTDRELLKLLNHCDPYVAEFFFGGKSIIVEGDTEYSAFMQVTSMTPKKYDSIHVIRARGKATIISLCKILNQFGAPYAVLHDSDKPTYSKDGQERKNPAWPHNQSIGEEIGKAIVPTRLVSSIPNFEVAYLGDGAKSDKPYNVVQRIKENPTIYETINQLLEGLVEFDKALPDGAFEWTSIDALKARVLNT
jgi:putative ATP-dependent endonuclease of OLD family